jgi:hypothetical protein
MNAPDDRLRAGLADLAEQVTVVDLRDRALRSSHRIAIRRTMLGGVAALAVLAAAGGTAFAVLPQRHNALPPAVVNPTGSPSPSPVASATAEASSATSSPAAPAIAAPSKTMPGLYFYQADDQSGATKHQILYRAAGGSWRVVSTLTPPTVTGPAGPPPLIPSPDRKTDAWIMDDGGLQVAAPDATHVRTLTTVTTVDNCLSGQGAAVWTGDSRRLVYVQKSADGKANVVKAANADGSGSHTVATGSLDASCSVATSGDGRTVGYLAAGKLTVAKADGTGQRALDVRLSNNQVPNVLIAVSPDGGRLLISTVSGHGGCGCSPPQQYYVVDASSGKATQLSQGDTSPISGAFTADGRVVLFDDLNRGNGSDIAPRLTLFGPDGAVLGHTTPPGFNYGRVLSVQG